VKANPLRTDAPCPKIGKPWARQSSDGGHFRAAFRLPQGAQDLLFRATFLRHPRGLPGFPEDHAQPASLNFPLF
jgi:hypothetical protein